MPFNHTLSLQASHLHVAEDQLLRRSGAVCSWRAARRCDVTRRVRRPPAASVGRREEEGQPAEPQEVQRRPVAHGEVARRGQATGSPFILSPEFLTCSAFRLCAASGVYKAWRREDQSDRGRDQRSVEENPRRRPDSTHRAFICGRSPALADGKTSGLHITHTRFRYTAERNKSNIMCIMNHVSVLFC